MKTVTAPFTPDQVQFLNERQCHVDGGMALHPFTCPNRNDGLTDDRVSEARASHDSEGGERGLLIATPGGWVCPHCEYTQSWAYASMAVRPTPVADAVFAQSAPSLADAWIGCGAYTLQLFFDFAGYSAMAIGIGQMLALIPGVSRSGGTITFGRAMGYTREAAVRVSFLMAIPAVFGAGILEAVSAVKDVAAGDAGMFPGWGPTIAAAIVAFVVGYVVIIGFLKFVSTFSYKAFAIYRIGLAIVVALLLITGVLSPLEAAAAA